MNIAFSGLLVIIILLPGILFRRTYFSTNFSSKFMITNFSEETLYSLIPALIFHTCFYFIVPLFGYEVDLKYVINLIILTNDKVIQESITNINHNFNAILCYNLIICLAGVIIGYFTKRFVQQKMLDVVTVFLRFQNPWYYIFEGRFLNISRIDTQYRIGDKIKHFLYIKRIPIEADPDFTIVDALVVVDDIPIIYSGYMEDYTMDKNGGLERIVLKYPTRRLFKDSIAKQSGDIDDYMIHEIPGDYLMIPYKNIENINFTYLRLNVSWNTPNNSLETIEEEIVEEETIEYSI